MERRSDRTLVWLSGATSILAVIALIVTVVLARVEIVQSRHDSCTLLRQIVYLATPPSQTAQADKFVLTTPLANCNKYAGSFLP